MEKENINYEIRLPICGSCLEPTVLKYVGHQEDGYGGQVPLHNCLACDSTITLYSLKNYEKLINLS